MITDPPRLGALTPVASASVRCRGRRPAGQVMV